MALLTPVLCDDLGGEMEHGREAQEGGDICVHMADSRRRQWQPSPGLLPGKIPWMEEPGRL